MNGQDALEYEQNLEGMASEMLRAIKLHLAWFDNTYDGEGMSKEQYEALEAMRQAVRRVEGWQ